MVSEDSLFFVHGDGEKDRIIGVWEVVRLT
jgi:hypothetical protein